MTNKEKLLTIGKAYTIYMLPFYFEKSFTHLVWENENSLISNEGTEVDMLYTLWIFFKAKFMKAFPLGIATI